MWFITRPIAFSLPGISRAENTTTSSGSSLHVAVVVDRDPRQRRLRLALRPGADADDVLRRVVPDVAVANLHAGRDPQIAEPLRDLRVVDHAAPDERDAAIELRREIDQDLHPVDARREHRDDDLSVGAGEDLLEGVDDVDLGAGEPLPIDVRAVGEQRQHAGRPELREPVKVDGSPSSGVWSILKSPVWITTPRGVSIATATQSGHAVRDAQELDRERRRPSRGRAASRRASRALPASSSSSSFGSTNASVSAVP